MSLQAELDHDEQTVLEYPELRSARAWSRPAIGNAALSADAGIEFVRARMPAPQPEPQETTRPAHAASSICRLCTTISNRGRMPSAKINCAAVCCGAIRSRRRSGWWPSSR